MNDMDQARTVEITRGSGHRTRTLTVPIPPDARLAEIANELRAASGGTKGTYGCYELRCVGRYMPRRPYTLTAVDVFTGREGEREVRYLDEECFFYHYDGELACFARAFFNTDPPTLRLQCRLVTEVQLDFASVSAPSTRVEGAPRLVEQTVHERNPLLRTLCIEHHGARCVVCGIDLGELYGDVAEGFVHVHHLDPLASVGEAHFVDPATDLIPVCPNCHGVIHLRTPPFTPSEVKAMLARSRSSL